MTFYAEERKLAQICDPSSLNSMWERPPPVAPMICLVNWPQISWPFSIKTLVSFGQQWGWVLLRVRRKLTYHGRSREKICLPVHRGRGLMIAGVGKVFASPSGTHIASNIAVGLSMKQSRDVISIPPSKLSYTSPMIGELLFGLIICLGTAMSSFTSAMLS